MLVALPLLLAVSVLAIVSVYTFWLTAIMRIRIKLSLLAIAAMGLQCIAAYISAQMVHWHMVANGTDTMDAVAGAFVGGCGFLFIPFVGATAVLLGDWIINNHWPKGYCRCGYDLNGNVSGICPECGTSIADQNPAQFQQPQDSGATQ